VSEPSRRAMGIARNSSYWERAGMESVTAEAIDAYVYEAVRKERRRCINDVCPECAGHACGWEPAEGPNEAGNYTHSKPGHEPVLCAASSIFSRERYEDRR
jgi:hypothetical protein